MSENEKLDAGTFDLGQWMQGKNTYPLYTVTVHVDRDAGKQLSDINKQIEDKNKRYDELTEKAKTSAGTGALTESPATSSAKEADQIVKDLKNLRSQREDALAHYENSALKITFQIKDRSAGENLFGELRSAFPDDLRDKSDSQIQDLLVESEEYARFFQGTQFMRAVSEMVNAQGQKADLKKLTAKSASDFLQTLSGDQQRLVMNNMSLAIAGGREVDTQVDAGFPG